MIKVLTVNCMYNTGSTGVIINDIADTLCNRCEFYFCYETGPKSRDKMFRIASPFEFRFYFGLARLTGLRYGTGYTSTIRLILHIKRTKPGVVHIHCPNAHTVNLYWLINSLHAARIPIIITNHAEYFYTGSCAYSFDCDKYKTGCGHCEQVFDKNQKWKYLFDKTAYEWKRMKKVLEKAAEIRMIAVSPWQKERMLTSPLFKHYSPIVIMNGINDAVFYPRENNIRREMKLSTHERFLLHVTSSFTDKPDDVKGGNYIIQLASLLPDIKIIVIGPVQIGDHSTDNKNLIFVGPVRDRDKLAEFYSASDLVVVTSKRETFGMICAESLSCGTPVVGFQAGGPESISLLEYSEFVEYGNISALSSCISRWINKKHEIGAMKLSVTARAKYSRVTMAESYYDVYSDMIMQ